MIPKPKNSALNWKKLNDVFTWRGFFSFKTSMFLGLWFLFMIAGRSNLFRDPGTFSHIRIGQEILSTGDLIYSDKFSFTCYGEPWIAQQWLGECIMAFIKKIAGFDGLLLVTVTALAFFYAWVCHRLIRSGLHFILAFLIIALTLAASSYHLHVRPHIISILFLGFTFSRLCDFEAGRLPLIRLIWLVPIFIVWTNIHGGVLGGLMTIALFIGGWSFCKLIKRESPIRTYHDAFILYGILLACILTIFVNPYGLELPKAWLSIMMSPVIPNIIQEHGSILTGQGGWIVLIFGVFYLVSFLGVLPKWPRITWLIPIIWLGFAISRIRHGPLFSIVAALALADIFPNVRWARWLALKGSEVFRVNLDKVEHHRISLRHVIIPFTLIFFTIIFQIEGLKIPIIGKSWVKLDQAHWPVELLPELQAYEQNQPEGIPILNDFLFGGFLIYYTPRLRVFIDDRCELYGDDRLLAYVNIKYSDFEEWVKKYRIKIALTGSGSNFDNYLKKTKGWQIVKSTSTANLYRKFEASRP